MPLRGWKTDLCGIILANHASTSARKRPGSMAGAFLKMATTAVAGTN